MNVSPVLPALSIFPPLSPSLFLPHSLSPSLSWLSVQRKSNCKWVPWTTGTPINKTVSQRCRKKKREGARGTLSLNISSPSTTTTLTPYPHCPHPPSTHNAFFYNSCHPTPIFLIFFFSAPDCPLSYSPPSVNSKQSLLLNSKPPSGPKQNGWWIWGQLFKRWQIKWNCFSSAQLHATR